MCVGSRLNGRNQRSTPDAYALLDDSAPRPFFQCPLLLHDPKYWLHARLRIIKKHSKVAWVNLLTTLNVLRIMLPHRATRDG